MNETIHEFKELISKELEILSKIKDFVEDGEQIGVPIDEKIKEKLIKAIHEVKNEKLKVSLVGSFSSGKTSIAAVWLGKLDKSTMKIAHKESSDEIVIYEAGEDILLVDTPGLFGFMEKYDSTTNSKESYKEITRKYVSESNLVLYIMESVNPLKESHKEELIWLFRELNLLSRTVFVLSKFDEVADIEDEESYLSVFKIKKESVINRLKNLINLNEKEVNNLSIVAVSANPFDMGLEYWLERYDEYSKISKISDLQKSTKEKIRKNGGVNNIIIETKKSIMNDILNRYLPESEIVNRKIVEELEKLSEVHEVLKKDVRSIESKINKARVSLRDFVVDYFSDLIMKVRGTSLKTFNKFFEKEIGSEGININARIQSEFEQHIGSVQLEIKRIQANFKAELDSFETTIRSYGKQGLQYLSESNIINRNTVMLTRNGIVNAAKLIGFDLSKYLKFKPWGAVKFAQGATAILGVASLALEVWDSYEKNKKEQEFKRVVCEVSDSLEKQKKELIELINSETFLDFFKDYSNLKSELEKVENKLIEFKNNQKKFEEWVSRGEGIKNELKKLELEN